MNARQNSSTPQAELQPDRSRQSVLRQLAALQDLTTDQLKDRWRDLYCSEPPAYNRQFLIRRLAYRIQELFHGGLAQTAREALRRAAEKDPMACLYQKPDPAGDKEVSIPDGTRFVRSWKGRRYEVAAAQGGFEFEGQRYRSLSAVAKQITGAHWNGRLFFGVKTTPRDTTQGKERS